MPARDPHRPTPGADLNQPQPDLDHNDIRAWAGRRLRGDVADLFADWLYRIWGDWDPDETPAADILQGALGDWRGDDPDE